jgi:hypothetical protein
MRETHGQFSVNVPPTIAMRLVTHLLFALSVLGSPRDTPAAEWVRVESPNFVVFGEVGEKRTREYASEFERFREALGRIVPGAAIRPAAPAVIFVFKNADTFAPYRPLYNGKPVQVGGYFAGAADLDVIMLAGGGRDEAMRTVYHEYSHLITANLVRGLPVWLGEGLAEYYSTFEVRADGKQAMLGGIIPAHLMRLNTERLLPLEELLTIAHDSPLYNEGSKRSMFYAQSWALVHLLLNGEKDRSGAFNEYVRLTAAGRPPLEAWTAVFAKEPILEELRRYVRQAQVKGFLFRFDREIPAATFTIAMPPPADVHAALGELRLHVSPETAAVHMQQSPGTATPFTDAVRGMMLVRENRQDEALPLLIQAAQRSDDWLVQYRAAVGLERIATASQSERNRAAGKAGDAALQRVLQLKPDLPHAVALRGLIAGPSDEGVALLKRARQLAPGRTHYAIWEAQYHSARGEFAEARQILAPMLSPRFPKETREYARSVMAEAADAQVARARAAGAQNPLGRPPAASGLVVPIFRELQPGEQRIDATLDRIECPRDGVVLHVRIGSRAAKYSAESIDAVEFLTYRADQTGVIQCGARTPPDKVYITWRAATGPAALDGIAVAVEFLPR